MTREATYQKGYQGSETTRVEVIVYRHADEPGFSGEPGILRLAGHNERMDEPSVVRATTQKTLGGVAGTFSVDIKVPKHMERDFLSAIADNDWVDIIFTKHGVKTLVMRGLVDTFRRVKTVSGTGATMTVFRLAGRDFGKIFQDTQIFFDLLTDGTVSAWPMTQVIFASQAALGNPAQTVNAFLAGFTKKLSEFDRANWRIPHGLAESSGFMRKTFVESALFFGRDFSPFPVRRNPIGFDMFPGIGQTDVWSLANEWSDPMLCELYTELLHVPPARGAKVTVGEIMTEEELQRELLNFPFTMLAEKVPEGRLGGADYPSAVNELNSDQSGLVAENAVMAVVFRDRPFPTFSRSIGEGIYEDIEKGPWFTRLPTYVVAKEHIANMDVGRSGFERKNAFFVSPRFHPEYTPVWYGLQVPLWDPESIKKHGFRRLDVESRYFLDKATLGPISQDYRERIRDYHVLNHLFLSGTVALGHGRPDVRIGGKLRVAADSEEDQETYYIEQVSQDWSFVSGLKTNLIVTRGWIGTDSSLISELFRFKEIFYETPAVKETTKPKTLEASVPAPSASVPSSFAPSGALSAEAHESLKKIRASDIQRVLGFKPLIQAAAVQHGVDAYILAAIMLIESRGRREAVNPKGAGDYGLMQINRKAHKAFVDAWIAKGKPDKDNIDYGASVLADSIAIIDSQLGAMSPVDRLRAAIAGYNAGPTRVANWLNKIELDINRVDAVTTGPYSEVVLAVANEIFLSEFT